MAAERRQKGKQMDKEERKKIHKKISIITLLALIVVIAVMIGGTLMGWLKIWAFQLIACLYLVGYWAATDILEPKLTKLLEGVTEDQKKAYKKYAAMDFAGYMRRRKSGWSSSTRRKFIRNRLRYRKKKFPSVRKRLW